MTIHLDTQRYRRSLTDVWHAGSQSTISQPGGVHRTRHFPEPREWSTTLRSLGRVSVGRGRKVKGPEGGVEPVITVVTCRRQDVATDTSRQTASSVRPQRLVSTTPRFVRRLTHMSSVGRLPTSLLSAQFPPRVWLFL